MKKQVLKDFIKRYSFNTLMEDVIWVVKDKVLTTSVISGCKSMIVIVKLKEMDLIDCELGVYHSTGLNNLLNALDDDVEVTLIGSEEKYTSVKFDDGVSESIFTLSETSTVPKVPTIKKIPEWDIEFVLDKSLIVKYLKSMSILKEYSINVVTFHMSDDKKLNITFGYSTLNTNRITIKTGLKFKKKLERVELNADYLKSIFLSNRDCDEMKFRMSNEGLTHVAIENDLFYSEYYMVHIV